MAVFRIARTALNGVQEWVKWHKNRTFPPTKSWAFARTNQRLLLWLDENDVEWRMTIVSPVNHILLHVDDDQDAVALVMRFPHLRDRQLPE